jgi:hypothetical protein
LHTPDPLPNSPVLPLLSDPGDEDAPSATGTLYQRCSLLGRKRPSQFTR